jgi:putative hydrolase of the HAD superfamily
MDTMTDFSHIEGIIWDLDDTLYTVTPALKTSMRESRARAVVKMGYYISFEEALRLSEESQEKYRLTFKILSDMFDIQKTDLHIPFHAEMDHTVTTICPDLPSAFAAHPHMKHSLMTHASRDWAMRMLDHMGIADFFDPKAVIGLEDIDFEHKHESDRATKTCLNLIGVDANKAAFTEDRDWNLTIPHEMGLTTILIDHPSQPIDLPTHVHHRFDNATHFMNSLPSAKTLKDVG